MHREGTPHRELAALAPGRARHAAGRRTPAGTGNRAAFTLLEMLLALGLLVLIGTLSWPLLQRPFAGQTLRYAADQIRVDWARARNRAITTGQTRVFHFQPETALYRVEPFAALEDQIEADPAAATTGTMAGSMTGTTAPEDTAGYERSLPSGITFAAVPTIPVFDVRGQTLLIAGDTTQAGLWSDPIFFYPDGTSTTADVTLLADDQRYVIVSLRGLTGGVTVSDVLAAEGMTP